MLGIYVGVRPKSLNLSNIHFLSSCEHKILDGTHKELAMTTVLLSVCLLSSTASTAPARAATADEINAFFLKGIPPDPKKPPQPKRGQKLPPPKSPTNHVYTVAEIEKKFGKAVIVGTGSINKTARMVRGIHQDGHGRVEA